MVAGLLAGGTVGPKRRRELHQLCRWQLWQLLDQREAELDQIWNAVKQCEWRAYRPRKWKRLSETVLIEVEPGEVEVDGVARLLADPLCTPDTRMLLLRGWGYRLKKAMEDRNMSRAPSLNE